MKKILKWLLIVLGVVTGLILALATAANIALNRPSVQNKLMKRATEMLSEKLQTRVVVDSVSVEVFKQHISLHGLLVEDQQGVKMLQLENLAVGLRWKPLLRCEVDIDEAHVTGLTADIYKLPDSTMNFQFIVDAFKRDSLHPKPKAKHPFSLNINRFVAERISADLKVSKIDQRLTLGKLTYEEGHPIRLQIEQLGYFTNNHLPRKNVGKPHRGFFDAGHMDWLANLKVELRHMDKDSICGELTHVDALDRGSGLHVSDLHAHLFATLEQVRLTDLAIRLLKTTIDIKEASVTLPSKKADRRLAYGTSVIRGRAILSDITRPFSPALKNFTLPLNFTTQMDGNEQKMYFRNINVNTDDRRLTVKGTGYVSELKDKHKTLVHFDVTHMRAQRGMASKIVKLFPVKKFMMKQLDAIGAIGSRCAIDVPFKKVKFAGLLTTEVGNVGFNFTINGATKYLTGQANTDSLALGKVFDLPEIGKVACKGSFNFDISKPRTAKMRRERGGKLPIGSVSATVKEASYKFVKVHNIVADIRSDGALAQGKIYNIGKYADVACEFSFTNTDAMQKMKVKPGMKFHLFKKGDPILKQIDKTPPTAEELQAAKEAKEKRREEKRLAKEAKKQQKAAAREEKRRAKEERRQQAKAANESAEER